MVEALLHRRDAEQKIPLEGFPENYAKLTLDQKKIFLKKIAYYMVNNEISAVNKPSCLDMIADVLSRFSGFAEGDAGKILDLLIERTGVLRELSPGRIDFLHNTFKEFLAAEKFIEDDLYMPLVSRATDSQWAPVLFFAAASADEKYVDNLLGELIAFCRRILADPHGEELDDNKVRAVSCLLKAYAVAISVEPSKRTDIQLLKSKILPPRNLDEAQLISSLGDEIINDLPNTPPRDWEAAKALARILAQIRTRASAEKAKVFLRERRPGVLVELIHLLDPLLFEYIRSNLLSGSKLDVGLAERIVAIRETDPLKKAKRLDFADYAVSDFAFLRECKELEVLSLCRTKIFDGEQIANCTNLKYLNLSNAFLTDFSFLKYLDRLETLNISRTPVESLDPLVGKKLRHLGIWDTDIHDIKSSILFNIDKVNTNSIYLRRELPREKLMTRVQAERVFGS